jgi:tetratricopeptide (TPR) repeat protein
MLPQLRDKLEDAREHYWVEQLEIQRRGAAAWVALAEGRKAEALEEMRGAAEREDRTEKTAVTPGPLAPARELLGEMLLQTGDPAQALMAFETTLAKEPNRFRAIAGAMKASAASGDRAAARKYATQMLKLCARADKPERPDLREARRILRNGKS